MTEEKPSQQVIQTEDAGETLTIDLHPRTLDAYPVTDSELTTLAGGSGSLNVGFFGTCVGAAISFVTTLLTANLSDRVHAVYVATAAVAIAGTIYFGARTWIDRTKAGDLLASITKRTRAA